MIITEKEKESILNRHFQLKNPNPVFDLVLTENEKYLILMDEVFENNGTGESLGSIWENTHVFDELLTESLGKLNILTESVIEQIKDIKWLKEDVIGFLKTPMLNEEEEESWFQRNIGKSWDNLKDGKEVIAGAFKGHILPLLRWIRRMSMTNIGMVIDIIGAILTMKGSAVVWFIISALDVYEIITNDYDPKDPDRRELPFFYLMMDIISAVFTAAAGGLFKVGFKSALKKGAANPRAIKLVTSILDRIPWVGKQIKSVLSALSSKMKNSSGFIKKIINGIDLVLNKMVEFFKRVFSKTGGDAVKSGLKQSAVVGGINKGIEGTIALTGSGDSIGSGIKRANDKIGSVTRGITGNKTLGNVRPNDLKTFEKFLIKNGKL